MKNIPWSEVNCIQCSDRTKAPGSEHCKKCITRPKYIDKKPADKKPPYIVKCEGIEILVKSILKDHGIEMLETYCPNLVEALKAGKSEATKEALDDAYSEGQSDSDSSKVTDLETDVEELEEKVTELEAKIKELEAANG